MFIEENLPLSTKGKLGRFLVLFHKFTLQLLNTVQLSIVDIRCIAHVRLEVFQNIEIRIGFSFSKKNRISLKSGENIGFFSYRC
jgi:hypothetical protein